MKLALLEHWLQGVITHPEGVRAGLANTLVAGGACVDESELESVVTPSEHLSALERVEIYSDMYFLRLVDCLREDFPCLAWTLGDGRFEKLTRGYVTACPSMHFSLNQLGAKLASHVATTNVKKRGFFAELAALERAIQEVFDEHASPAIGRAELEAVPQSDWPSLRLVTTPALRLFAFRYPVNRYYQAFKDGRRPKAPSEAVASHGPTTWCAVYRKDYQVWRANLTHEQHALLAELMRGAPLGRALEACVASPGFDATKLGSLGDWFREWASEGLFVGLSVER
ncbi:MAG: DNA-binding domain-containing protein [Planctomycetes bacterium]|nr:DNA-binding domain-containing protein [Planctomycetota bacterium]